MSEDAVSSGNYGRTVMDVGFEWCRPPAAQPLQSGWLVLYLQKPLVLCRVQQFCDHGPGKICGGFRRVPASYEELNEFEI